jgi:hypothetical protein
LIGKEGYGKEAPGQVKATTLLWFWSVREADISLEEPAQRLTMSSPGVVFTMERGEAVARKNGNILTG